MHTTQVSTTIIYVVQVQLRGLWHDTPGGAFETKVVAELCAAKAAETWDANNVRVVRRTMIVKDEVVS